MCSQVVKSQGGGGGGLGVLELCESSKVSPFFLFVQHPLVFKCLCMYIVLYYTVMQCNAIQYNPLYCIAMQYSTVGEVPTMNLSNRPAANKSIH